MSKTISMYSIHNGIRKRNKNFVGMPGRKRPFRTPKTASLVPGSQMSPCTSIAEVTEKSVPVPLWTLTIPHEWNWK
jgi:hypothetical protein